MSRVTMQDLYSDLSDGVNEEIYDKVAEIEVVPRKIVELIIEECDRAINGPKVGSREYIHGVVNDASFIKGYAEGLLHRFEGSYYEQTDNKDNN